MLQVIQGIFYRKGDTLCVADDVDGEVDVLESLKKLDGRKVRMVMHFRPPDPPALEKWGGGCCYWEGAGDCPAGHHQNPKFLFQKAVVGRFQAEDMEIDGTKIPLDLLEGHDARIVVLVDELPKASDVNLGSMEERMVELDRLRAFLEELTSSASKL